MKRFIFLAAFFYLGSIWALNNHLYVSLYEEKLLPSNTPRPIKPLMWTANLKVESSIVVGYEANIFSPNRFFSLYSGVSSAMMKTVHPVIDDIYVCSCYLLARFYLINTFQFKTFIIYSPAGPSFLSKSQFATTGFSNHFVFQNQFGLGFEFDKDKAIGCFFKMYHFSNGDLFPVNGGIDIPLVFGITVKL